MADGEIRIDTKINTDGVDKGVKDVKNKVDKLGSPSGLKSIGKLGAAFAAVTTAVKLTAKAIKETTEAYQQQKKAEIQLETAAKNNPYLDGRSVKQLKDYAGELQKIGTIGDEQILPMMSQLATAGRTQEEIQNIMSAALDVSASGMMSFESAVNSLNASFNGTTGALGRQIGELKNLTAEELKNGKAVEIVAAKFKGMSEQVTKATGTSQQLKNAWGDLKEEIGAGFEKALSPMRAFFTNLISGWAEARKARREYEENKAAFSEGTSDSAQDIMLLEQEQKKLEEMNATVQKYLAILNDEEQIQKIFTESRGNVTKARLQTVLSDSNKAYEKQLRYVKEIEESIKKKAEEEKNAADEVKRQADEAERKAAAEQRNKSAADLKDENTKALNKSLKQQQLQAELNGKEIDQQEKLNILISSYIDLVTTDTSLVTENNDLAKQRLEQIKALAATLKTVNVDFTDLENTINEFLGDGENSPLSDTIQSAIESLYAERAALEENGKDWEKYTEKIAELAQLKTDVLKKEGEAQRQNEIENIAAITAEVNGYLQQFNSILSSVTDLVTTSVTADTEKANAELSKQYTDGLISYEKYCEEKENISRKAARDEYKIQMWTWAASLAQATANIAEGVAKAIAQGGTAGIITGALVAAAGAAQIASITASKPQAPKFAAGGIVSGNSYTGDHITGKLNAGEMVLTASQQAQLWKQANGRGGGTSLNVKIENNVANEAKVSTQLSADGLRVTIDKLVTASMSEGRYNSAMETANKKKSGVSYL